MKSRDKTKHKWFSQHILQKATNYKAKQVKEMVNKPNIQYKVKVEVVIKNGRIILVDSKIID